MWGDRAQQGLGGTLGLPTQVRGLPVFQCDQDPWVWTARPREAGEGGRVDLGTLYFVLDFAVFEPKTALKIKFINEV